jgi:ATP-dependent DNA helicase DinG
MTDYIDEVFGPAGIFASAFPGYEPRPGQLQLARAVDRGVREGEPILAEAPTGTGKSLAYLVPAIWHVTEGAEELLSHRPEPEEDGDEDGAPKAPPVSRVLVVTANIALQEQLVQKDLPTLQRLLPWQFSYAIAKGRSNYLCVDRFEDAHAEMLLMPLPDREAREQWKQIVDWAGETATGDVSELPFEPAGSLRQRFTTTSDDCTGGACPKYRECYAERAKRAVKQANVVVTNYHLLCAHLAIEAETGARVLPEYDIVIMDEGHAAADVARDFFGFQLTTGKFRWAVRLLAGAKGTKNKPELQPIDKDLRDEVGNWAESVFGELYDHLKSRDYQTRLSRENVAPSWPELKASLGRATKAFTDVLALLDTARKAEVSRALRRIRLLTIAMDSAMALEDEEHRVYFLEENGPGRVTLASKPLDVSEALKARLFQDERVRCCVVTSATLATSKSDSRFDYIAGQLGIEGGYELVAPTPFDFQHQALAIVPAGLPQPTSKEYAEGVARLFPEIVELAGGRTLGLFTSYRVLNAVYQELSSSLIGRKYRILKQGSAPRSTLIREFKADVTSVLLGTESFWTGIDAPGETCSCVVIDRIPFESPGDPVNAALDELHPKTHFREWSIPRAAIKLKQGFGRLVRARSDRGVVVLLDRRLLEKPYGKTLLKGLPEVKLSRDLSDVARFLGRVHA